MTEIEGIKNIPNKADSDRINNANGAQDKDIDAYMRGKIDACNQIDKLIPQGDSEGLLTSEEQNSIVEKAMDEDSAVYIAVNRGHWERITPLLLKAQQALSVKAERERIIEIVKDLEYFTTDEFCKKYQIDSKTYFELDMWELISHVALKKGE